MAWNGFGAKKDHVTVVSVDIQAHQSMKGRLKHSELEFEHSPDSMSTTPVSPGFSHTRSDSETSSDDKLDQDLEDMANWHEDQGSIYSQQNFPKNNLYQEMTDPEQDDSEAYSESEDENQKEMNCDWCSSYDFTVFNSELAVNKIPNSDTMTKLEWLCYQFHRFVSHPSMSKAEFTHNLQMQKIIHNDKDNIYASFFFP
ncbi:uncharacterized protein LOC110452872 [Mizuhopecten yessoensis]|uniref:uncharacterized protein LOC110452872 n=1 Tax=Mizuhopecten yessoensis TaxID=6573 RepID=UPI000B459F7E|nr:uncharacterized protein LOC110452872 [Mizuhopecten yessoensis]